MKYDTSFLYYVISDRDIALHRILETVVTFHFSGGKVYSLNKGCHTCMIKHTMHVQSLHCSRYLTWLDVCKCCCCQPFGRIITDVCWALWYTCHGKNSQEHLLGMCVRFGCRKKKLLSFESVCVIHVITFR